MLDEESSSFALHSRAVLAKPRYPHAVSKPRYHQIPAFLSWAKSSMPLAANLQERHGGFSAEAWRKSNRHLTVADGGILFQEDGEGDVCEENFCGDRFDGRGAGAGVDQAVGNVRVHAVGTGQCPQKDAENGAGNDSLEPILSASAAVDGVVTDPFVSRSLRNGGARIDRQNRSGG